MNSITYLIRFPDGSFRELMPTDIYMDCHVDELPRLQGTFIIGRTYDIESNRASDELDNFPPGKVLDEFLSQFAIIDEGGDDV